MRRGCQSSRKAGKLDKVVLLEGIELSTSPLPRARATFGLAIHFIMM